MRGFTLIETIVTFLLVAIVALTVSHQFTETNVELSTQTSIIRSHLRYAHARAIAYGSSYGISFNENEYYLYRESTTNKKKLPNTSGENVTFSSGISAPDITIEFDNWGTPCTVSGNVKTSLPVNFSFNISQTGGASQSISISPVTGFIQ